MKVFTPLEFWKSSKALLCMLKSVWIVPVVDLPPVDFFVDLEKVDAPSERSLFEVPSCSEEAIWWIECALPGVAYLPYEYGFVVVFVVFVEYKDWLSSPLAVFRGRRPCGTS